MNKNYSFFTSKEIKPKGWLYDQLVLQKNGLNGNLDKVWPDVRDSKWIGGEREGWERVPYWLDGFVPLAYLLDDEDMKARAKVYIDKIIENQDADGWICPNGDTPFDKYDTWAVILIAKVLTVYYDCSGDERVPDTVYKILKNYHGLLKSGAVSLFEWAEHRWYEAFISLQWIKDFFGEERWMLELAHILREQGTDYEAVSDKWETVKYRWEQDTHVVNLAMMLKSEAVTSRFFGEEYRGLAEKLLSKLCKYHEAVYGMFTGDECLDGRSPIAGTELCAVVEMMYTLEHLYAVTGDSKWAERLELLAFNALPATVSEDMWTHQYVQMSNQIACAPISGRPPFGTNGGEAHIFGLEPHFGCCTSNFGQGWPKFVLSAFMKNSEEIVSSVTVPSELSCVWNGVPVKVTLDTCYPFENKLSYTVTADARTDMRLKIRIPSFAVDLTVNGAKRDNTGCVTVDGFEAGETKIEIAFDVKAKITPSPTEGLNKVTCGSLIFSANIGARYTVREYTKDGVERRFPYCDYTVEPISDWQLAFASDSLKVIRRKTGHVPFSSKNPPITVEAELCHIDWGYEYGYDTVCSRIPRSVKPAGEKFKLELCPYGCAKLRMTEMPIVMCE